MLKKLTKKIVGIGSGLKSLYKVLTDVPRTVEEADRHYSYAVRVLQWSLNGYGGFYISDTISKRTKWMLAAYNALTFFVLIFTGNIYYALNIYKGLIKFDLFEIFCFTGSDVGFVWNLFVIPAFIAYYRVGILQTLTFVSGFKRNFHAINLEIDRMSSVPATFIRGAADQPTRNTMSHRANLLVPPLVAYALTNLLIFLYSFSPTVNYILFDSDERPPIVTDYIMVPAFYDRIKSLQLYYLVTGVLTLSCIPVCLCCMCGHYFIGSLVLILYDNAFDICEKINCMSRNYTRVFENILLDEKINPEGAAVLRSQMTINFEKDMNTMVKELKKCTESIKSIRPFLNSWLTIMVIGIYGPLLSVTAILVTEDLTPYLALSFVSMDIALMIILYVICKAGKTFSDMGEMYSRTIYGMPWYYLPPKARKSFNLFQTATALSETKLYVMKVYPINMTLFPRVLNSVYSYVNVLRAAKLRNRPG